MSCPKTKLISAYLDQEAGHGEKTALETHVKGCNICSHTLEEMRSLRAGFAQTKRYPAPYGFAARVMARAAEPEKKKTPWLVTFFVSFAEAAVLLIVITVGIIAGWAMTNGRPAANTATIASSLSLDLFDATPSGSLDSAYLAMTEVRNEK